MKRKLAILTALMVALSVVSMLTPAVKSSEKPHVIFEDDFERVELSPWFQVDGWGPDFQGTGTVAIEDDELSITTDSYWYNVYGVCRFETTDADFELSAIAKIMADSAPSTGFAIGIGEITGDVNEISIKASNHIEFGYNGYYKQWDLHGPPDGGLIERFPGPTVNVGIWTKMVMKKLGDSYEFYVNDELIHSRAGPSFAHINYVYLCNGVGVHGEGGTHVHHDNVLLYTFGEFEKFARLAEGRAEAYAAYATAVYYFTPEADERFYRDVVNQSFVELIPIIEDLVELELASDAYKVVKALELILDFKKYLDGLEEAIVELIPALYQLYAEQTYSRLREIEDLCWQEADAWREGDLSRAESLLEQEHEKTKSKWPGAAYWAILFWKEAKVDDTAYAVAEATLEFLGRDHKDVGKLLEDIGKFRTK